MPSVLKGERADRKCRASKQDRGPREFLDSTDFHCGRNISLGGCHSDVFKRDRLLSHRGGSKIRAYSPEINAEIRFPNTGDRVIARPAFQKKLTYSSSSWETSYTKSVDYSGTKAGGGGGKVKPTRIACLRVYTHDRQAVPNFCIIM